MDQKKLERLVEPILSNHGLELDAFETVPAGKRTLVRIVVDGDGANGRGPTLDEISVVTRAISKMLDAEPAAGNQSFTLEVSSRGIGRPLTQPKHFRRNVSRLVRIKTSDENFVGRIKSADETEVLIEIDGTTRQVPYTQISKAIIEVEMKRKDDLDDDTSEREES